jgi:hypothetical protein
LVPKLNLMKNLKRLELAEQGFYSSGSNSYSTLPENNDINASGQD